MYGNLGIDHADISILWLIPDLRVPFSDIQQESGLPLSGGNHCCQKDIET